MTTNMNNDTTYNGWTNRATWCVALWMDNDGSLNNWREIYGEKSDKARAVADLAAQLELDAQEMMDEGVPSNGMLLDLMLGTLASVNWREIATNTLSN
jgi:hypothetical protein